MTGTLALVGSGEYLPVMAELESELFQDGVSHGQRPVFVQLATAAGQESDDRLEYWKQLGARQAERIEVEVDFVPVFSRSDAERQDFADRVSNAALIYFSGGDPGYLADVMRGTPVWEAVERSFRSGSSLAGCSAGAMFMARKVPSIRFLKRAPLDGVALTPELQVIPHFDRIHHWVPDAAVRIMTNVPDGVTLLGIDEDTALVRRDRQWRVWGRQGVHVLNGTQVGRYSRGAQLQF